MKLSQAALAELLGITQSMVSMLETGERRPSIAVLVKLADIFNCSTDDLLDRKEA